MNGSWERNKALRNFKGFTTLVHNIFFKHLQTVFLLKPLSITKRHDSIPLMKVLSLPHLDENELVGATLSTEFCSFYCDIKSEALLNLSKETQTPARKEHLTIALLNFIDLYFFLAHSLSTQIGFTDGKYVHLSRHFEWHWFCIISAPKYWNGSCTGMAVQWFKMIAWILHPRNVCCKLRSGKVFTDTKWHRERPFFVHKIQEILFVR